MKSGKSVGARPSMRSRTKPEPNLDREIQSKIGQQLRTLFDDVVKQGVPDRFVDLLGRLDERTDKK
jgi:hypothetical protein